MMGFRQNGNRFMTYKSVLVGLAFAGFAIPAFGEDAPDCKDPQNQSEMTYCAGEDAAKADKALNAQYKVTRASQAETDAVLTDDLKGAEKSLVKAQRAWIAFRDAECELEGFQARGGTMEPMLVEGCKARLTIERTRQLKGLNEGL